MLDDVPVPISSDELVKEFILPRLEEVYSELTGEQLAEMFNKMFNGDMTVSYLGDSLFTLNHGVTDENATD